jgi:predicted nucleic acid-binding protein
VIVEDGSELLSELWATPYPATSSILSYPEARAALAAARRGGRLSVAAHRRASEDFESLQGELSLIGIDAGLARQAGQLAEQFALRGYDAVHLASALSTGELVTLVSWDNDLRRAATENGCAIAPPTDQGRSRVGSGAVLRRAFFCVRATNRVGSTRTEKAASLAALCLPGLKYRGSVAMTGTHNGAPGVPAAERPAPKSPGGIRARATTEQQGPRGTCSRGREATVSHARKCEQSKDSCKWCATHPNGVCVACTHRGRIAASLLEDGMSVAQIAERLRVGVRRAERLIEMEHDRRDLARYRCDTVPVESIQRLVSERQEQDPSLSLGKLAALAGHKSRISFERLLGYAPTAATTKNGKHYPARLNTTIGVQPAAVIVRALGYAPHEIPGL